MMMCASLAFESADLVGSTTVFVLTAGSAWLGIHPARRTLTRRENHYAEILRAGMFPGATPRQITMISLAVAAMLAALGFIVAGGLLGAVGGLLAGAVLPDIVIARLRKRRVKQLESQLVSGIQSLAAGARAGLNLVQAMELVARDGPAPLRDEFARLLREYEYGTPLEEAMNNAAGRIGSGDFGLLFSALQTHRERGGDLGLSLDRIADSIREIQRLENRIETLTAQGRANARFLGLLVIVVLAVLYMIDNSGIRMLFTDDLGKVILALIVALNAVGFLWIRRIVAIDI